jgi:hypothetical protein
LNVASSDKLEMTNKQTNKQTKQTNKTNKQTKPNIEQNHERTIKLDQMYALGYVCALQHLVIEEGFSALDCVSNGPADGSSLSQSEPARQR